MARLAIVGDLMIDNEVVLGIHSRLYVVADHAGAFAARRHGTRIRIGQEYLVIRRWTQRKKLRGRCRTDLPVPPLSVDGRLALGGIGLAVATLLVVSGLDIPLGLPTAIVGVLVSGVIPFRSRSSPSPLVKHISWGVLPLVARLFVLVEALDQTGVTGTLAATVRAASPQTGAAAAGVAVAIGDNLVNNLPAGLIARSVVEQAPATRQVTDALLIGIDLGPALFPSRARSRSSCVWPRSGVKAPTSATGRFQG